MLRGKAHAEWKVVVSGDRRTVKDDQVFIDDRAIIWGKDKTDGSLPILPRGQHAFSFRFQRRRATAAVLVRVQALHGALLRQGDHGHTKPLVGHDKRAVCCLCCQKGVVSLRSALERSAYCCGESLRLKADIDNQSEEEVRLKLKLIQEASHTVLEYRADQIQPAHAAHKFDSSNSLVGARHAAHAALVSADSCRL
ncbi:hypothetical protein HPB48_003491 [Haemaphysalis longicornis]|uniref:Arrestin C-terminal-like domain-containing protein n=1 Tax=Haemaphysalis longicornis TaxID=44386 RepID=A0A9J6FK07_HAELO|nr:hypothetical protein HPB48_003491 [Haemaphysalis longicornis]